MTQVKFSQELNLDQFNVKTPAEFDSNVNKWIMHTANYAKNAGGVWVPVSPTDPMPTSLTGRKASIVSNNYDQTLNVNAGGNTTIYIQPPVGQLWRIKSLYLNALPPTGATAGTHALYVGTAYAQNNINSGRIWALQAGSNYIDSIRVQYLRAQTATNSSLTIPTTDQGFQTAILSLVVTNANPLAIYYSNNTTGGTQSGLLNIGVQAEVENIV